MSAAWFLAWLSHVAPEWLFYAILFGVPAVVIIGAWWLDQRHQ